MFLSCQLRLTLPVLSDHFLIGGGAIIELPHERVDALRALEVKEDSEYSFTEPDVLPELALEEPLKEKKEDKEGAGHRGGFRGGRGHEGTKVLCPEG